MHLVGKLGRGHAVFCGIFESVFPRLGHKNEVFGHAWTVLGRGLDTFWTACLRKNKAFWVYDSYISDMLSAGFLRQDRT